MGYAYDSKLLAYLAVLACYAAIGFSVTCHGLCWCVGFHSDRGMERVSVASFLLLTLHVVLRELGSYVGLPREALGPFSSPVAVVGSFTLYLALLITSSLYYYRQEKRYALRNGVMLVALVAGAAIGYVSGVPGLSN